MQPLLRIHFMLDWQAMLTDTPTAMTYLALAVTASLLLCLVLIYGAMLPSRQQRPPAALNTILAILIAIAMGAWVGLAARNEWDHAPHRALTMAAITTGIILAILTLAPRLAGRLEARIARQKGKNAIGQTGEVYRTLEGWDESIRGSTDTPGRVELPGLGLLPAIHRLPWPLAAFTPVRVVDATDQGVVIVESNLPGDDQGDKRAIAQPSP